MYDVEGAPLSMAAQASNVHRICCAISSISISIFMSMFMREVGYSCFLIAERYLQ